MFDELFDMMIPDQLECILEVHDLKEHAKELNDNELVEFIINSPSSIELDIVVSDSINDFFSSGSIEDDNRIILENCYTLLKNKLCVGLDGKIYTTDG